MTTHPGNQGGFYRNRTARSSPWAWENSAANTEKVVVIRRHLLRSGIIQKSVTLKKKKKVLLKIRDEVKKCSSWVYFNLSKFILEKLKFFFA